ncbi:hypothetical protein EVAR_6428_1 [Eumeta japonica]|uniref:Uncharacterized protein n=1 Tax=Eumeta variegata TaxID=151549 RepID=A0A4C1TFA4_EUMVA|nr:hypothetical protein EVAR_6428_1 [Eumeta japonica]
MIRMEGKIEIRIDNQIGSENEPEPKFKLEPRAEPGLECGTTPQSQQDDETSTREEPQAKVSICLNMDLK